MMVRGDRQPMGQVCKCSVRKIRTFRAGVTGRQNRNDKMLGLAEPLLCVPPGHYLHGFYNFYKSKAPNPFPEDEKN